MNDYIYNGSTQNRNVILSVSNFYKYYSVIELPISFIYSFDLRYSDMMLFNKKCYIFTKRTILLRCLKFYLGWLHGKKVLLKYLKI